MGRQRPFDRHHHDARPDRLDNSQQDRRGHAGPQQCSIHQRRLGTLFDTLLLGGSAGLTNYTIASFSAGNLSGTFENVLNLPGTHLVVYDNVLGEVRLEVIPEPSAFLLAASGLMLLLLVRRRAR